jgi:hypothetical protein
MLRNKIILKIWFPWLIFGYAIATLGAYSFYDRYISGEIDLLSLIINTIIGIFLFIMTLISNYISTVIDNEYIRAIGPKIKPFYIEYKKITQISLTIFPIWWPVKFVVIEGIGDKGKEISMFISNLHTNFKEALVFIKNHVEEDVIEETLLKYIKRCEAKK